MGLWTDIRYALRVLTKNRSFTLVAVLTLAVSIGANTAIFSMADAIVFHPYPFPNLDRIAALWETIPAVSAERYGVSPGDYFDWTERNHVFAQMAAYQAWDATLTGAGDPQRRRYRGSACGETQKLAAREFHIALLFCSDVPVVLCPEAARSGRKIRWRGCVLQDRFTRPPPWRRLSDR